MNASYGIHMSYISERVACSHGAITREHRGRYYELTKSIPTMWKQWVNAILGVATIAVPFLGLTGDALTWTLVIMGALILVFSVWTASEIPREEYERLTHSHA